MMVFIRDLQKNQIIDPERGAVLKSGNGQSWGQDWEIHWDNHVIGFTTSDIMTYGGPNKNTPIAIEWFVQSIRIPDSLAHKKPEIMSMIRESLVALGMGSNFKGPSTVKFDPRLVNYN